MITDIVIAITKAALLVLAAGVLALLAYDGLREILSDRRNWHRRAYALPVALACFSLWLLCIAVKLLQTAF